MFSFNTLFSEPSHSRFDNPLLKGIRDVFTELCNKDNEIKKAVSSNASHPGFLKSKVLSELVAELEKIKQNFNATNAENDAKAEKQAIIGLIDAFIEKIDTVLKTCMKELSMERPENKMIKKSVDTVTSMATHLFGMPGEPAKTASVEILERFSKTLTDTKSHLECELDIKKKPLAEENQNEQPTTVPKP